MIDDALFEVHDVSRFIDVNLNLKYPSDKKLGAVRL
jgi:hypothetical protein